MEIASPKESGENLDFDNLVAQLSQNLGVTSESLAEAFDKSQVTIRKNNDRAESRKHFFRNQVWTIHKEQDDEGYYIIENRAGGRYRIGTTTVKQLNQATLQMVEKIIPIVVDMPTRFRGGGRQPDSFEVSPGIHPADE